MDGTSPQFVSLQTASVVLPSNSPVPSPVPTPPCRWVLFWLMTLFFMIPVAAIQVGQGTLRGTSVAVGHAALPQGGRLQPVPYPIWSPSPYRGTCGTRIHSCPDGGAQGGRHPILVDTLMSVSTHLIPQALIEVPKLAAIPILGDIVTAPVVRQLLEAVVPGAGGRVY